MLIRYRDSISRKVNEMVLQHSGAGLMHDSGRLYLIEDKKLYLTGTYNWPERVDRNKVRWVRKPKPLDLGQIHVGTHVEYFNRPQRH